jgi:C4-dicarboxylate-specific signal transduction histidine kinase
MEQHESAFLGRISAGMTHEIKNVLAIIKESSGLMEDLLALSRDASFPYREKFQQVLATIRDQVGRGVELTTRLNRFAHSMDEPVAEVELNDLIGQMAMLMQRFARLKKVQLQVTPAERPITVRNDPFRLQLVLAACVDCLLAQSQEGAVIRLQAQRDEQRAELRVVADRQGLSASSNLSAPEQVVDGLSTVLQALQAELAGIDTPEQGGFRVVIPMELSSSAA